MKRTFVLTCAALIGLTGSAAVAAGAQAAEKPLAPIASAVLPDAPTDAAAQQMEDASVDMLAHPEESAGSWYDGGKRQVVLGLKGEASAAFGAELAAFTKSGARVQPVTRSFGDLRRISDAVMAQREIGGAQINRTSLDWRTNQVAVGLQPITDAARQKLAALYGDAVTVEEAAPLESQDGPDRRRDRYPYWGGSAWSVSGGTSHVCSTAFPMKRPDNSKKFLVTAGHCNSPTARDAYTANTAATTGSSCGYQGFNNFTSIRTTAGNLITPVVRTSNTTGSCTRPGDSGGAVYRPATGGIRASGIHNGGNATPGDCTTYYTSIYYAQQLFDAVTVTTSNY